MDDLISRQAAIDAVIKHLQLDYEYAWGVREAINALPSAQPEPAIPLQWIEAQIEWLKSLDNAFSNLTALQISAMVNKWKDGQDG